MATHHADALVLFGITGDLARRRLFPALYEMAADGDLGIPVIGVARTQGTDSDLRSWVAEALADANPDPGVLDGLGKSLRYVSGDYSDQSTYREIRRRLGDATCTVAYLAVPPFLFEDVVHGLAEAGLNDDGRLVVEKPFGRDLKTAEELNTIIHGYYPESRVFRIDHFLGKEALQNLMVYRFSNSILEPIWNRHYIRGVQITMAEEFGVEGRGGFYDSVGTMRDVVQNHLLVLISLLAMEPPVSDSPDALRDERVKVLESMKPLNPEHVVRGQYEGYRDEPGVAPDSDVETYFAARFEVDSWRWAGVPWVVRAGKGMADTLTEAVVEFERPPRMHFADEKAAPGPNRLTFRSKPDDRIILSMQAKKVGDGMVSVPVDFELKEEPSPAEARDAYHRLLRDALRGDPALFAREDGVMASWRVVEPILTDHRPVHPYKAGSWGPEAADVVLGPDWRWLSGY